MAEAFADLSLLSLIWCGTVVLVAGYIRGYSGFGFSAVLMAGLSLVLTPAQIVPLSITLEIFASLQQGLGAWRDVAWRTLAILVAAGIVATPLGIFALTALSDTALTGAVLAFIAAASLFLMIAKPTGRTLGRGPLIGAGLTAGVVNGATALSGLVLALVFTATALPAVTMRATLIAYFLATDLWAGLLLWSAGFTDQTLLIRAAVSLPVMGLGIWLGGRQFIGASQAQFRAVVLWLLVGLCSLGFARLALV